MACHGKRMIFSLHALVELRDATLILKLPFCFETTAIAEHHSVGSSTPSITLRVTMLSRACCILIIKGIGILRGVLVRLLYAVEALKAFWKFALWAD